MESLKQLSKKWMTRRSGEKLACLETEDSLSAAYFFAVDVSWSMPNQRQSDTSWRLFSSVFHETFHKLVGFAFFGNRFFKDLLVRFSPISFLQNSSPAAVEKETLDQPREKNAFVSFSGRIFRSDNIRW